MLKAALTQLAEFCNTFRVSEIQAWKDSILPFVSENCETSEQAVST